jgi:hypothetical protein
VVIPIGNLFSVLLALMLSGLAVDQLLWILGPWASLTVERSFAALVGFRTDEVVETERR